MSAHVVLSHPMNPTFRLLLLAVVFLSCGRSLVLDTVPVEVDPPEVEDALVEVRVGTVGHCTRSRLGRVECEGTGGTDASLRFTLVERGALSLSVGGGLGYCGQWLTACALLEGGRVTCALGGSHVCFSRRYETTIEGAQSIATGNFVSCVLKASGEVLCGSDMLSRLRPIEGLQGSVAISCGDAACCGLDAQGAVSCLDIGATKALPHPLASPAVEVSVGFHHACALDETGVAHCWTLEPQQEVPAVPLSAGLSLSSGGQNVCVLDARGVVHCGGLQEVPFDVPLVQAEAGAREVCGLDAEAELHCVTLPTP